MLLLNRQNYDAEFCGRQPLHNTNQIQPHGVLLVASKTNLGIVQASENIHRLLSMDAREVTSLLLSDILTPESFRAVESKSRSRAFHTAMPLPLSFIEGRKYLTLLHEKDDCLIFEIEFANEISSAAFPSNDVVLQLQTVMAAINDCRSIQEVVTVAAREIKALSGFDKVMIYSFDEEWNGTVIAEAMNDGMETYLGLKFPSSDVPRQARELYLKNPYRIISDINYEPVRLYPDVNPVTGLPTDLSDCRLRSVIAVHLEYLRNMRVVSSMSTRIIHKEQLWGLIACHHQSPKFLSLGECAGFEFLSGIISSRISSITNRQSYETNMTLNSYFNTITENMSLYTNLVGVLKNFKEPLMKMLGADGVAICWSGEISTIGLTPDSSQTRAILDWLITKQHPKVFSVNSLSAAFEDARNYANIASGLLVLPIQPYEGNYVLAFRAEAIKKVSWGGNPDEAVTFEKDSDRYHPRNSFQVWKETVRNTSAPWSPEEMQVAERFRNVVVEHTLRALTTTLEKKVVLRTEELEKSRSQLEQTYHELMQITYVASHDLQEPVRKINLFGNLLKESFAGKDDKRYIDRLIKSSQRIRSLLNDLISYSTLSRSGTATFTDLNKIVEDVINDFDLVISEKNVEIHLADLPEVEAVADQMRQVFYSLISNSIKFKRPDTELSIVIKGSIENAHQLPGVNSNGPFCRITVSDNGLGFNSVYAEHLFEMFRKIHPEHEFEGTGIGLAIAKKIIEKHHGKIEATGVENEGATFTIILPLKQQAIV